MKCPKCKHPDSNVVDSRRRKTGRVRRRECPKCKHRFSTTEILGVHHHAGLPLLAPMVVKKNGALEPFDRKKLYNSIVLSVRKPRRNTPAVEKFVNEVEEESAGAESNMSSAEIGRRVLEWLRGNDKMGYLRYASVHEELNSPEDFIELVTRLQKKHGA